MRRYFQAIAFVTAGMIGVLLWTGAKCGLRDKARRCHRFLTQEQRRAAVRALLHLRDPRTAATFSRRGDVLDVISLPRKRPRPAK
jgi:hypothetical protein